MKLIFIIFLTIIFSINNCFADDYIYITPISTIFNRDISNPNNIVLQNVYHFYCINDTVVIIPRTSNFGSPVQLLNTKGLPMNCNNSLIKNNN